MQHSLPPIAFHFLHPVTLKERNRLKHFLAELFRKEKKAVEAVNYIFCSDAYLLELNQSHLNHNTYTDIITFELSAPEEPLIADIYISVERIRDNAEQFKVPVTQELHRVVFHGALHCCGYGDKTAKQAQEMRHQEDKLLQAYFVPRGTK